MARLVNKAVYCLPSSSCSWLMPSGQGGGVALAAEFQRGIDRADADPIGGRPCPPGQRYRLAVIPQVKILVADLHPVVFAGFREGDGFFRHGFLVKFANPTRHQLEIAGSARRIRPGGGGGGTTWRSS